MLGYFAPLTKIHWNIVDMYGDIHGWLTMVWCIILPVLDIKAMQNMVHKQFYKLSTY